MTENPHSDETTLTTTASADVATPPPETLTGAAQPPLSCGKPKYLIVLLHDQGSSGDSAIELSLEWAPTLNKGEFLAPNAPWPVVNASGTFQWISGTAELDESIDKLHGYLDQSLSKRRLAPGQLALVGFGQGAALALSAGLSRAEPLGAIVAVGRGIAEPGHRLGEPRSAPPILLVEADLGEAREALTLGEVSARLRALNLPLSEMSHPGDYFGLDEAGLQAIARYLREVLAGPEEPCD